jgi:tRNA threonylcarbamoyladenosine biosynthesis protein TsaE
LIRIVSRSVAGTQAVAASLAPLLRPGDVILLGGELGAGKTVFTQGLGRALGITEAITSPTFTLVRTYDGPAGTQLVHADLYRLEHLREVVDLGLAEMIDDSLVTVIEWGEVAAPVLRPEYLDIQISFAGEGAGAGDDTRVLDLTPVGPAWVARAGLLRENVQVAP